MDKEISSLLIFYEEILKSPFVKFDEVKNLKKITGVYMVFDENEDLLYVGSSINLKRRFMSNLVKGIKHSFANKLLKDNPDRENLKHRVTNLFKYKIYKCGSKREAEALEYLLIYIQKPKKNKK